jgi:pimeloyl-ACP methyl ester carboxylesterase
MLHGIASTHRYWEEVSPLLTGKRHMIMPNLLGFGRSPKPRSGIYNLDQQIACLKHTLEAYDFSEPPVLVGHSMGAIIALRWAVLEPERFAGLVLTSPVFFEEGRIHEQMASIILEGRELTHRTLARMVTFGFGLSGLIPSRLGIKMVHKWPRTFIEDVCQQRYHVYRKLFKNNNHFMPKVLDDLAEVQLPLRLLVGEHDPPAHHAIDKVRKMCERHQNCQVQVLDCGHQVPLDYPEKVAEAILSV